MNETAFSKKVKANPDLQRQLTLLMSLSNKDHTRASMNAFNANEVLQIFRMNPWDYSWEPPLAGDPSEVANDIHMAVKRAISRVPPFDFVKCGLGYSHKANFIGAIMDSACTTRNRLREEFEGSPQTKSLYIEVEKVSADHSIEASSNKIDIGKTRNGLAHWIVASSISRATNAPYDALALGFMPIQKIFAENEDFVLERLEYLSKQFSYIGQKCNWDNCSTDLSFWEKFRELLWSYGSDDSNEATVSRKATEEKWVRFARNPKNPDVSNEASISHKTTREKRAKKVVSIVKRLRAMFRWRA